MKLLKKFNDLRRMAATALRLPALVREYESRFGNVLNTDNAKLLFVRDGYNPADADSVRAFHNRAGLVVAAVFQKWLYSKRGTGRQEVIFTGGGNGSGKSTFIGKHVDAAFVVDSTMASINATRRTIEAVLHHGFVPRICFIYRDPVDAWQHGIVSRQENGGHTTPISVFANTHSCAKNNFLLLCREFGDRVIPVVMENHSGGTLQFLPLAALAAKPSYTKQQILEALDDSKQIKRSGSFAEQRIATSEMGKNTLPVRGQFESGFGGFSASGTFEPATSSDGIELGATAASATISVQRLDSAPATEDQRATLRALIRTGAVASVKPSDWQNLTSGEARNLIGGRTVAKSENSKSNGITAAIPSPPRDCR